MQIRLLVTIYDDAAVVRSQVNTLRSRACTWMALSARRRWRDIHRCLARLVSVDDDRKPYAAPPFRGQEATWQALTLCGRACIAEDWTG